MKNVLLLSLLLLFTGCSLFENENDDPAPSLNFDCTVQTEACTLSELNSEFAWDVFAQIQREKPDENIFISPLSISTALSMTMNGAKGETLQEMQQTLGYDQHDLAEINRGYQQLLEHLPYLDQNVELGLANSIWHREDFAVLEDFLSTNQTFYQSQVEALDFTSPGAADAINDWVDQQTNGLIDEIVRDIPPQMVMYLINAIYFKGDWLHPFDPEATTEQDFHLQEGGTVPVDMMSLGKFELEYFSTPTYQAVDLPYGDSIYSMTIFVPHENYTLQDIHPDLDQLKFQTGWADQFSYQEVFFSMPKFELEFEAKLNETLQTMGMPKAFTPNVADFSGIAPAELFIDEVKHKAFIEVDEEGTEAAAVTSIGIGVTSTPSYPFVVLDRPFYFVIRENVANNILFIGKMVDPTQ